MEEQGWFKPTMERLDGIARYPDKANEWSCKKVTGEALMAARSLLCRHMRPESSPPRIQPTDEGGILMEWHEYWVDLTVTVAATGVFDARLALQAPTASYEAAADAEGVVVSGFHYLEKLRLEGPPPLPERPAPSGEATRLSRKLNQD